MGGAIVAPCCIDFYRRRGFGMVWRGHGEPVAETIGLFGHWALGGVYFDFFAEVRVARVFLAVLASAVRCYYFKGLFFFSFF